MKNLFSILSVTTSLLSLAAHISTFMPSSRLSMSDAWPLHLCAMIVFGAMIITLARKQKEKQSLRQSDASIFQLWVKSIKINRESQAAFVRSVPMMWRILCVAIYLYALINFALFMKNSEGGGPFAENDRYYLKSHGHVIRELSEQKFHRFRLYELRFFLAIGCYFLYCRQFIF